MATSGNAQLMALSGPRNPYPEKLGVFENGAYADLLLVAGDPLKDVNFLAVPDKNLIVIMKAGKIHKDIRANEEPSGTTTNKAGRLWGGGPTANLGPWQPSRT